MVARATLTAGARQTIEPIPFDDHQSRTRRCLPRISKSKEACCAALRPGARIEFAYSPENLRLGHAIEAFTKPDRIVIGTRGTHSRPRLAALFAPFSDRIEWMSVESAEMTKHALNAFLAASVAFINEIAAISERVGADAAEIARGLKTDARIGPRAYLSPGAAFAGGTLARDVIFLSRRGAELGVPLHLIPSVRESNEAHREWALRRLESVLGSVKGKTVAVWGLTYKPGTDTLRRSGSVARRTSSPTGHKAASGSSITRHETLLRRTRSCASSCTSVVNGKRCLKSSMDSRSVLLHF